MIENRFVDWQIDLSINKKPKKNGKKTGGNSKIGVGGGREAPSITKVVLQSIERRL